MSIKQSEKPITETQTKKQVKRGKRSAVNEKASTDVSTRKEQKQRQKAKTPVKKEVAITDPKTRKQQKKLQKAEKRKNKKPRRRIFPIWLRIIVVLLLAAGALLGGLMMGYGVIGDGVPKDALKMETWKHIIDIVTKKE